MDKCFFLIISDSDILDENKKPFQLLGQLVKTQTNAVVYIIVPQLSTAQALCDALPSVNCIVLDLEKDIDVNKGILGMLPKMDCILDYTGNAYETTLRWVREIQISGQIIIKSKDIGLSTLNENMKTSRERTIAGPILFAVRKKKKDNVIKGALKTLKNEGEKLVDKVGCSKNEPVTFQPGPSFSSQRRINCNDESQPLLQGSNEQSVTEGAFSDFINWICCCNIGRKTGPTFQNREQLRNYARGQHHLNLRRRLFQVLENGERHENRQMVASSSQNVSRELQTIKSDLKKEIKARRQEYEEICKKNKENPPQDEIFAKTAAYREKHALRKLEWAEKNYASACLGVQQEIRQEKVQNETDVYNNIVSEELRIFREEIGRFVQIVEDLEIEHHA